MVTAYWIAASITLGIVVSAFLKDKKASRTDPKSFLFIALAALLWPITLPFILRRKLQRAQAKRQAKACSQSQETAAAINF
ncbi:MAG: hypothetical protein AAFO06_17230 [Cyanobacteria bacterium J06597_16]